MQLDFLVFDVSDSAGDSVVLLDNLRFWYAPIGPPPPHSVWAYALSAPAVACSQPIPRLSHLHGTHAEPRPSTMRQPAPGPHSVVASQPMRVLFFFKQKTAYEMRT